MVFLFISWTQAWAQGQYNPQDRSYEMTYEDLVQELSAQKKNVTDSPTEVMGFDRIQALFGYSFSAMNFNLATKSSSFNMNGIDIRANGQLSQSNWQLEGGLKNYAKVSNGDESAESRILTTSLRNQNYLNAKLLYVIGFSSSVHWINTQDSGKSRNEIDLSLNIVAGVRSPLSPQLSWGIDINAYSPVSGKTLKGGVEAVVLLSSTL